jgi:hypothetical protein
MSSLNFFLFLIFAAILTAWVIIRRRKETVLEIELEESKERHALEQQKQELRAQKYKQMNAWLKEPFIQSLWDLCEEACYLGLVDKFSNEQFNLSYDSQRIDLTMSWVARDDGASQLALRKLAHKHATKIATQYGLFLSNIKCDDRRLELEFAENTIVR